MAKVQVNNVVVLDNPSPFYNPFQFEITFECIEDLSEGEWRRRRPPGCQLRLQTLKVSRARSRGGGRRGAGGRGRLRGGKLEVDGRRPLRRAQVQPQPGRLPGLNLRATCSAEVAMLSALSGGRRAGGGSRDPHSHARRSYEAGRARRAASATLARRGEAGPGAERVWSRRLLRSGAIFPEKRIGPATPASRRLLCPATGGERGAPPAPSFLPGAPGRSIFRAYGKVAVLPGWPCRPRWEGSELSSR